VATHTGGVVGRIGQPRGPSDRPDYSGVRTSIVCLGLLLAIVAAACVLFSALENVPWREIAEEARVIPPAQNPWELFPHRRP
jgi:hypothetical protein